MVVENNPRKCCVTIWHTAEDIPEDITGITELELQSRIAGREWKTVKRFPVLNIDDLLFQIDDYSPLAHLTYEYRVIIFTGNLEWEGASAEVETSFKGILVTDGQTSYVCYISPHYQVNRNYNMAYVKPFYSKYPHSIQNGDTNYSSGSVDGIFNRFDCSSGVMEEYGDYTEAIMDFLTNGIPKVIKTHDGHGWYAMINTGPQTESDNCNLVKISFEWTEVLPYPSDMAATVAG